MITIWVVGCTVKWMWQVFRWSPGPDFSSAGLAMQLGRGFVVSFPQGPLDLLLWVTVAVHGLSEKSQGCFIILVYGGVLYISLLYIYIIIYMCVWDYVYISTYLLNIQSWGKAHLTRSHVFCCARRSLLVRSSVSATKVKRPFQWVSVTIGDFDP